MKSILITGASTGIGKACALHLDTLGYRVFAGVRNEVDGAALQRDASERLAPVFLDVTDESSIFSAVERIARETDGTLDGLINNAGIGRGGALEAIPMEEIRTLFDVNVIGLLAMTKAVLPLVLQAKGCIINMGSTAGIMAFPGASAYSASKFAVRALTDSLRLELKPLGVRVVLVAPGAVESRIWEKGAAFKQRMREHLDPAIAERYRTLRAFGDRMNTELKKIPAQRVADIVEEALTTAHPNAHYLVGRDAKGAAKAARLPKRLLDWMILKRIAQSA